MLAQAQAYSHDSDNIPRTHAVQQAAASARQRVLPATPHEPRTAERATSGRPTHTLPARTPGQDYIQSILYDNKTAADTVTLRPSLWA